MIPVAGCLLFVFVVLGVVALCGLAPSPDSKKAQPANGERKRSTKSGRRSRPSAGFF